jgi:hypothetical protein
LQDCNRQDAIDARLRGHVRGVRGGLRNVDGRMIFGVRIDSCSCDRSVMDVS